jgi:hypothetical protein
MLGDILRYVVRHPRRAAAALARNPAAVLETVHDRLIQRREYRAPSFAQIADPDWEQRLHARIGAPWPCPHMVEFWALWPRVLQGVEAAGVNVGPASFNGYNDGDAAFVRAIWCLVRHLGPEHVVETGVAHGFTSRFILEALQRNGNGHLSSIDRPPLDPAMRQRIGIAVGGLFADRWTLIAGSSRQQLPPLLSRLRPIDLFIHDSLHTERNVRFELDRAWTALRCGGALVVDDIDSNRGFQSFTATQPGFTSLVCEAAPVRPDTRRFNEKGLFGIILKDTTGT